jgi:hypothetical protein
MSEVTAVVIGGLIGIAGALLGQLVTRRLTRSVPAAPLAAPVNDAVVPVRIKAYGELAATTEHVVAKAAIVAIDMARNGETLRSSPSDDLEQAEMALLSALAVVRIVATPPVLKHAEALAELRFEAAALLRESHPDGWDALEQELEARTELFLQAGKDELGLEGHL